MVPSVDVNLWAVLVAAIINFIVGALWYSPMLFGNTWIKYSGWTKQEIKKGMQKKMHKEFITQFIITLIGIYVLAHFVVYTTSSTISDALQLSFWLWLGFAMPISMMGYLWEGKHFKIFLIQSAHTLVSLAIASIILINWK